jgi:hypothetical protein
MFLIPGHDPPTLFDPVEEPLNLISLLVQKKHTRFTPLTAAEPNKADIARASIGSLTDYCINRAASCINGLLMTETTANPKGQPTKNPLPHANSQSTVKPRAKSGMRPANIAVINPERSIPNTS